MYFCNDGTKEVGDNRSIFREKIVLSIFILQRCNIYFCNVAMLTLVVFQRWLFQNLIRQLKSGKRFKCRLEKRSTNFKLVEWQNASFEKVIDPVKQFSFGDIEIFQPAMISLRRVNKRLVAAIKSTTGFTCYGSVSQDWAFWFLTKMRDESPIHVIVNCRKFSNGYTINQGNFGPCSLNFQLNANYSSRCIRTHLDNKDKFFFA